MTEYKYVVDKDRWVEGFSLSRVELLDSKHSRANVITIYLNEAAAQIAADVLNGFVKYERDFQKNADSEALIAAEMPQIRAAQQRRVKDEHS